MLHRAKLEFFLPGQPMLVIEQRQTNWWLIFPITTYVPVARAVLKSAAIELTELYDVGHELLDEMASEHWQVEVNNS